MKRLCFLFLLTACDRPKSVDPETLRQAACTSSQALAQVDADQALLYDWPLLQPLFDAPADPAADAKTCAAFLGGELVLAANPVEAADYCGDAAIRLFENRSDRYHSPMGVIAFSRAVRNAILERHGVAVSAPSPVQCVAEFDARIQADLCRVGGVACGARRER